MCKALHSRIFGAIIAPLSTAEKCSESEREKVKHKRILERAGERPAYSASTALLFLSGRKHVLIFFFFLFLNLLLFFLSCLFLACIVNMFFTLGQGRYNTRTLASQEDQTKERERSWLGWPRGKITPSGTLRGRRNAPYYVLCKKSSNERGLHRTDLSTADWIRLESSIFNQEGGIRTFHAFTLWYTLAFLPF